jgi:outer membrane receptor protein involved in Fe transport
MSRIANGLAALACSLPLLAFGAELPRTFSISAQPLSKALLEFSKQSDLIVTVPTELVEGRSAPEIRGELEPMTVLEKMLEGSGLRAFQTASGGITIGVATTQGTSDGIAASRVAQAPVASARATEQSASAGVEGGSHEQESGVAQLEEIVVTGTHIRGDQATTAPLIVISREQIDRSGYSTTQDLLRALPQNFVGGDAGASEDGVFGIGSSANANNTSASGINLRGLGTSSSLVLLNGHRIAPSMFGSVVDISLIPLAAVERVEILTSGSSAIYGSDAVGGVVNFILKKEYDGSETTLRYGGVTDGRRSEVLGSQTFGGQWAGGGAVASIQYQRYDALSTRDRDFTANVPRPTDLFPQTETYALALNAHHRFTDRMEWYTDLLASKRDIDRASSTATRLGSTSAASKIVNLASGVRYELGPAWTVELGGLFGRQQSEFQRTLLAPPAFQSSSTDEGFTQSSADLIVSGTLFETGAGAVDAAFGTSYRREVPSRHTTTLFGSEDSLRQPRNVKGAFAELSIPLVGADNRIAAIHSLDLSAALRYDDYSDFGSTTNPRVGLRWAPTRDFAIRGSYSRSFRAPNSLETGVGAEQFLFAFPFVNPNGGPDVPTFILGGSTKLSPERARIYDVGLEFRPQALPGITAEVGYYDIRYSDRITLPPFDPTATVQPEVYGALLSSFSNDAEAQAYLDAAVASGLLFFDDGNGATGVRYVFDGRQQNAAVVRQSGYDFKSSYSAVFGSRTLKTGLNATYIVKIDTAFAAGAHATDLVDTFGNPTAWRFRWDTAWSGVGWTVNGAVNYVDAYINTSSVDRAHVSTWTTVDASLRVDAGRYVEAPAWQDLSVTLSAQNIFNREPPFVAAPGVVRVNYDAANASPLGRFVALELRKKWK